MRALTNALLGSVVDAAVKAGGNALAVNYVSTDLSPAKRKAALNAARAAAVADAIATARLLAGAAGVKLGPLTTLVDGNWAPPTPQPLPASDAMAGAAKQSTPTTMQVGTTQVVATVTATFGL